MQTVTTGTDQCQVSHLLQVNLFRTELFVQTCPTKIPHVGHARTIKAPPHLMVPHPGITLVAA